MIPTRACRTCKCIKIIEEFCQDKKGKWGHSRQCLECERVRTAYYAKHREPTLKVKLYQLVYNAGMNRGNVEFDYDFIVSLWEAQGGRCAYTNREMTYMPQMDDMVSLDRKDSSIGYTKENVHLTCWTVNKMKTNLPEGTFLEYCLHVAENNSR